LKDCVFCKIVEGSIKAEKVYEDDDVLAFDDITPQAPVHTLVIPKKHLPTLNDVGPADAELIAKVTLAAIRVAKDKGLDKTGYRLVTNCLEDGGQAVFHIHTHVLGGRAMNWPPG
jgi:histidine triad (HIT) family protein